MNNSKQVSEIGITFYVVFQILAMFGLAFSLILMLTGATDPKLLYQLAYSEKIVSIIYTIVLAFMFIGLVMKESDLVVSSSDRLDQKKLLLKWVVAFYVILLVLSTLVLVFSLIMMLTGATDPKLLYQMTNGEKFASITFVNIFLLLLIGLVAKESPLVYLVSDDNYDFRKLIMDWVKAFYVAILIITTFALVFSTIILLVAATERLDFQLENAQIYCTVFVCLFIAELTILFGMKNSKLVSKN